MSMLETAATPAMPAQTIAAQYEPGLVSVVIPTYNRAQSMRRAIDSVLAQTHHHVEVVVVDDGSADDTREVASGYPSRVRYFWQKNSGVAAARNAGLRAARGEFIALLDSDDRWHPWKVAAQLAVLRSDPTLGMVWSDMTAVDESGRAIFDRYLRRFYELHGPHAIETAFSNPPVPLRSLWPHAASDIAETAVYRGDIFSRLILGNCVHTSTVLLRRDRLRLVGGFDESLGRSGEDYEFHFHTCAHGPVAFLDVPTTLYQIGAADQLTASAYTLQIARSNLRTVEKWLSRARERIVVSPTQLRWRLAESHGWIGEEALQREDRRTARSYLWKSLRIAPRQPRRVVQLAATFAPPSMLRSLRRLRARLRTTSLEARP